MTQAEIREAKNESCQTTISPISSITARFYRAFFVPKNAVTKYLYCTWADLDFASNQIWFA